MARKAGGRMAEPKKSQATSQPTENLQPWLQKHRGAFDLLEAYAGGDISKKIQMQAAFSVALSDDSARGPVIGNVGSLMVDGFVDPMIFVDIVPTNYGEWMAGVILHYIRHAKEVGMTSEGFNRTEGDKVWEALVKAKTAALPTKGFVARIAAKSGVCPDCPMQQWLGQEPQKGSRRGDIDRKVGDAIKRDADPRAQLESRISEAEARLAAAKEEEDFDVAKLAKAELESYRQELAKLEADVPPLDPRVQLEGHISDAEARLAAAKEEEDFDSAKAAKAELASLREELAKLEASPLPVDGTGPKPAPAPTGSSVGGLIKRIKSQSVSDIFTADTKTALVKRLSSGEDPASILETFEALIEE